MRELYLVSVNGELLYRILFPYPSGSRAEKTEEKMKKTDGTDTLARRGGSGGHGTLPRRMGRERQEHIYVSIMSYRHFGTAPPLPVARGEACGSEFRK